MGCIRPKFELQWAAGSAPKVCYMEAGVTRFYRKVDEKKTGEMTRVYTQDCKLSWDRP